MQLHMEASSRKRRDYSLQQSQGQLQSHACPEEPEAGLHITFFPSNPQARVQLSIFSPALAARLNESISLINTGSINILPSFFSLAGHIMKGLYSLFQPVLELQESRYKEKPQEIPQIPA